MQHTPDLFRPRTIPKGGNHSSSSGPHLQQERSNEICREKQKALVGSQVIIDTNTWKAIAKISIDGRGHKINGIHHIIHNAKI